MTSHRAAQEADLMTERAMLISDLIVDSVQTVRPDTSLRDALSRMRLSRFRHLPVTDDDGRLVAVVSDRDILQAWSHGAEHPVAGIMKRQPRAVRMNTPALHAAEQLLQNKIGALPVLDDEQRVVGIVTATDFLSLACRALVIYEHWQHQTATAPTRTAPTRVEVRAPPEPTRAPPEPTRVEVPGPSRTDPG